MKNMKSRERTFCLREMLRLMKRNLYTDLYDYVFEILED